MQRSVAIGKNAAKTIQGMEAISIGFGAGFLNQSQRSIAIGCNAGMTNQGENSVAIGYNAGFTNQTSNSNVIGYFNENHFTTNTMLPQATYISNIGIGIGALDRAKFTLLFYNNETKEIRALDVSNGTLDRLIEAGVIVP